MGALLSSLLQPGPQEMRPEPLFSTNALILSVTPSLTQPRSAFREKEKKNPKKHLPEQSQTLSCHTCGEVSTRLRGGY